MHQSVSLVLLILPPLGCVGHLIPLLCSSGNRAIVIIFFEAQGPGICQLLFIYNMYLFTTETHSVWSILDYNCFESRTKINVIDAFRGYGTTTLQLSADGTILFVSKTLKSSPRGEDNYTIIKPPDNMSVHSQVLINSERIYGFGLEIHAKIRIWMSNSF